MPKRIGFLYGAFVSERNCIRAERLMAKNKTDNKMAVHIGMNAERYGKALSQMLKTGAWVPSPNREITIKDSYKGKTRDLKIPCLLDQSVQYAWLNIACPYIEKRNYYYNCGSIPGAGQTRAVRKASVNLTVHAAQVVMNYVCGIMKWCNSYNFRKEYVYPHISIKKCREVISHEARRILAEARAV